METGKINAFLFTDPSACMVSKSVFVAVAGKLAQKG